MENVSGCDAEYVLTFLIAVLPMYELQVFRSDAADFTGPLRVRVYFIGVLRGALISSIANWTSHVLQCRVPRHLSTAAQHTLTPASTDVLLEQRRLRLRKHHIDNSVHDRKWVAEHKLVRAALGSAAPSQVELPKPVVRGQKRKAPQIATTSSDQPYDGVDPAFESWIQFYAPREQDLIQLISAASIVRFGINVHAAIQWFDVTEPTSHGRLFSLDQTPPILRTHRIFSHHLRRHQLGLESLFVQGFPHDIQIKGLCDRQLRSIAGNTISVQMIEAYLGSSTQLMCTNFIRMCGMLFFDHVIIVAFV